MGNNKRTFLKYFFDLIIVAFGVFLGMFVSEWWGQKKMDSNVEKSLNNILNEMKSNRENIENAIDYHEKLKTTCDTLFGQLTKAEVLLPYYSNTKFKHNKIKGWRGFGFAGMEDIAFESTKISGVIQELDLDLIQLISSTYKHQKSNLGFSESTVNKMVNMDSNTKTLDVIGIIELIIYDGLANEKSLKNHLDNSIEELSKVLN